MSINQLRTKWEENAEHYKTAEIGGGVHDFVNDIFKHPELFALKLLPWHKKSSLIANSIYTFFILSVRHLLGLS